jgi:hypothetical protein
MAELVEEDDDSQNKQKSHNRIKHHGFRTFESKELFQVALVSLDKTSWRLIQPLTKS